MHEIKSYYSKIYIKWRAAPIIGSFAQKPTPMYTIPFPAVTICPVTKASSKFVSFTENYNILTFKKTFESLSDDA